MRILFWFVLLVAAAVGLAVVGQFNTGNVAIFFPPYRIDVSLNFFVLAILALFICLYILVRTVRIARSLPSKVIAYRRGKRETEANKQFREAIRAYLEGRFGHAEKAATKASDLPENAGIAALIGARCSQKMHQEERTQAWLASTETNPELKTARLMTELEMEVGEFHHKRALEIVEELNASGARHIQVLQWALKANQQAKNWEEVLRLVSVLEKRRAINPTRAERLIEIAYDGLMANVSLSSEGLRRLWSSIPAAQKVQPFIAAAAAKAFNVRGLHEDARQLLEKALKENWEVSLIRAYRDSIDGSNPTAVLSQIEKCEQWLLKHPNDAELMLTLGSLCVKQKLWGQVQKHLEQALSSTLDARVQRECHLGLARMFDGLGQADKAAEHYKKCAELIGLTARVPVVA